MFRIVTDTSANLPTGYLHAEGITVIPYTFQSGKGEQSCMDLTTFDAKEFYAQMRSGVFSRRRSAMAESVNISI